MLNMIAEVALHDRLRRDSSQWCRSRCVWCSPEHLGRCDDYCRPIHPVFRLLLLQWPQLGCEHSAAIQSPSSGREHTCWAERRIERKRWPPFTHLRVSMLLCTETQRQERERLSKLQGLMSWIPNTSRSTCLRPIMGHLWFFFACATACWALLGPKKTLQHSVQFCFSTKTRLGRTFPFSGIFVPKLCLSLETPTSTSTAWLWLKFNTRSTLFCTQKWLWEPASNGMFEVGFWHCLFVCLSRQKKRDPSVSWAGGYFHALSSVESKAKSSVDRLAVCGKAVTPFSPLPSDLVAGKSQNFSQDSALTCVRLHDKHTRNSIWDCNHFFTARWFSFDSQKKKKKNKEQKRVSCFFSERILPDPRDSTDNTNLLWTFRRKTLFTQERTYLSDCLGDGTSSESVTEQRSSAAGRTKGNVQLHCEFRASRSISRPWNSGVLARSVCRCPWHSHTREIKRPRLFSWVKRSRPMEESSQKEPGSCILEAHQQCTNTELWT